jgi:hypothetical protein
MQALPASPGGDVLGGRSAHPRGRLVSLIGPLRPVERDPQGMSRDGSITFSDLIGKLDTLHVTCDKCGLKRRYTVKRAATAR